MKTKISVEKAKSTIEALKAYGVDLPDLFKKVNKKRFEEKKKDIDSTEVIKDYLLFSSANQDLKEGTIENPTSDPIGAANDFRRLNHLKSRDIKLMLNRIRRAYLDSIREKAKKDGKNEAEAKKVSYKMTTQETVKLFHIAFHHCVLDEGEEARLFIYDPAQGIYTSNRRIIRKYITYLEPYLNSHNVEEVIKKATSLATVKKIDTSGKYIACPNCLINVDTKQAEEFSPKHIITTKIATEYHKHKREPNINGWTIEKMFDELACHDKQVVKLFWQIISDVVNGNVSHQKAIMLVGNVFGNNGKGTFQQLLINLVGQNNYATMRVEEFDIRFQLSRLEGKTLVIGDDISPEYIEHSSNFNSVITNDPVTIEHKGKDAYPRQLFCTVIQSCNEMPRFQKKVEQCVACYLFHLMHILIVRMKIRRLKAII